MASRYFLEPTCVNPKYPCGICAKTVSQRHKAIQCDSCNYWNHVKCDQISDKTYESLQKSEEPHYCQICKEQNVISTFLTTENEDSQSSKVIKNTVVEKVYHCGTCKKKSAKDIGQSNVICATAGITLNVMGLMPKLMII